MLCDFPFVNMDRDLAAVTPADIEQLQKQEIEALSIIYPKELTLLSLSFPFKLQLTIHAFLENDHLIFPSDFVDYSVVLIVELTPRYPFCYPMFKLYSAYKEVTTSPMMKELEAAYPYNFPNPSQNFLIQEFVEKIRDVLMTALKSRCKRIRKIRHKMDPEDEEEDMFYAENDWSHIQNLAVKSSFTPLNLENFTEWAKKFNAEKRKEELAIKKADPNKDKPSGKEIFLNIQTAMFVEEGAADLDDEDGEFDLGQALRNQQAGEGEEDEEEEDVEVDEDVFKDEDQLMEEMFN
jgi:hypothetical protein